MESREVDLGGKLTILREVQVERRRLETCDSISESEDSAVTSKEVKCICPPTTKKERDRDRDRSEFYREQNSRGASWKRKKCAE